MNQKAFKKSLTTQISSKDEPWQGFLGGNVPNRNDDSSKPEQAEAKKEEKSSKKDKDKEKKDKEESKGEAAEKASKAGKNDSQGKSNDKAGPEKESGRARRQKNYNLGQNEKPKLQKGHTEQLPPTHKNKTAALAHDQLLRSDMAEQFEEAKRPENEFDASLEKIGMIDGNERQ